MDAAMTIAAPQTFSIGAPSSPTFIVSEPNKDGVHHQFQETTFLIPRLRATGATAPLNISAQGLKDLNLKSPSFDVISLIRKEIVYFEEGGPGHTDETIDLAFKAAKELGIRTVVVASTTGDSGVKTAERFKETGVKVIVVGHQFGYPLAGESSFNQENREKLKSLSAEVYLGTDVLTTSIRQRNRLGPSPLSTLIQTMVMMKVKVNIEVIVKATDAGLLAPGERVISLAGSHHGLDTAIIVEAQDSANILDIRVRDIIAIPLSRQKADAEYMKKMRRAKLKIGSVL